MFCSQDPDPSEKESSGLLKLERAVDFHLHKVADVGLGGRRGLFLRIFIIKNNS
jgi:hypothetical protein